MAHFEGLSCIESCIEIGYKGCLWITCGLYPSGYKGTKLGYKLYPKINHIKQALMKQGTNRVQRKGQGERYGYKGYTPL
jgi:hypothetical protein